MSARYKKTVVSGERLEVRGERFCDLTGGYGVDTYFLREGFEHTDYVEQDAELCRIAEHNFRQPTPSLPKGKEIGIHNCTAEEFLNGTEQQYDLLFLDPARRDSHGGKVFRLADCSPNVVALLPTLLAHLHPNGQLMLKLSPMLDITQAMRELAVEDPLIPPRGGRKEQPSVLQWDVHVVAIKNEVKEVLLVAKSQESRVKSQEPTITAIDLAEPEKAFVFTREEEGLAVSGEGLVVSGEGLEVTGYRLRVRDQQSVVSGEWYLYEPNAAILKAGAYKLVGQRFGLSKLDVNTHLYCSEQFIPNFPGRTFRVSDQRSVVSGQANVLTRNYPLTAEQLRKKLKVRDGGELYIIGCRIHGKPTILYAERIVTAAL